MVSVSAIGYQPFAIRYQLISNIPLIDLTPARGYNRCCSVNQSEVIAHAYLCVRLPELWCAV